MEFGCYLEDLEESPRDETGEWHGQMWTAREVSPIGVEGNDLKTGTY